jgi:pilus assembly protein CpaF
MLASVVPLVNARAEDLRDHVRERITSTVDPQITDPFSPSPHRTLILKQAIIRALRERGNATVPQDLIDGLFNELVGLGPLQPLMDDPGVTDILVNRFDQVYVEREGHLQQTGIRFRDQGQLVQLIHKIAALVGREINLDKPIVDARMADGSRANAVCAPVGGPTLCIRKFRQARLLLSPTAGHAGQPSWVSSGGLSAGMAQFLETAAAARANILIAGATGAGKSTLLRSLAGTFPLHERIVTIEDTAELLLENPHWVRLECVHMKDLSSGDATDRHLDVGDLVQNALRMRPDRLIVGEIRHPKEAICVLEALSTGHDGSVTTIHASGCADSLARLELLISRDFSHLSPTEIRRHVARVFDVVVFVARLRNGRRRVLEIDELAGTADDQYDLRPVFRARRGPEDGELCFEAIPGYQPGSRLRRKFELEGVAWPS